MPLELPSERVWAAISDMSSDRSNADAAAGGPSGVAPPPEAGQTSAQQRSPPPPPSRPGTGRDKPRSHNLVWVNPNFAEKPATKESGMTDSEVRARMGLGNQANPQTPTTDNTPPPNKFGKRPKSSGPTPPSAARPAQKKRKKGKKRVVTSAQQRLEHARALQAESGQSNPTEDLQGSASTEQTQEEEPHPEGESPCVGESDGRLEECGRPAGA